MNKEYYTTREAAFLLKQSIVKVQRDVKNGLFPGYKTCPKTSCYLIPAHLLPEPELKNEENLDELFIKFIVTDILTNAQREKIRKIKPKPKEGF